MLEYCILNNFVFSVKFPVCTLKNWANIWASCLGHMMNWDEEDTLFTGCPLFHTLGSMMGATGIMWQNGSFACQKSFSGNYIPLLNFIDMFLFKNLMELHTVYLGDLSLYQIVVYVIYDENKKIKKD